MRIVLLILCGLLAWPAAAAVGSESSRAAYARFKSFDRDGDRSLSRAELLSRGNRKGAETLFLLLDADGDGRLALKEVEAAGGGGRLGRFDAFDANKDGFVARGEFPTAPDPRLLAALDRDGDGRLALSELRPAFAGFRPRTHAAAPTPPRRAPPPPATWCWVPAIGDDGWGLEAPVLWSSCHTTARP